MRSRHAGSCAAGMRSARLPCSTESRAQQRSASSAEKVIERPLASCVSVSEQLPKTASGRCIRTPITSAEPHTHGFRLRVAPCTQNGSDCVSPGVYGSASRRASASSSLAPLIGPVAERKRQPSAANSEVSTLGAGGFGREAGRGAGFALVAGGSRVLGATRGGIRVSNCDGMRVSGGGIRVSMVYAARAARRRAAV